jgi:hypothetical protein
MMTYKKGGYEAHITVDKQYAKQLEVLGEQIGWVFSQISGCPLLGQGTYCYLTNYDRDSNILKRDLEGLCNTLKMKEIPVLRFKIEHIILDSKTGVNEFN